MNKLLCAFALIANLCLAGSLDMSGAKIEWKGFKFANKTAVKGSFSNVSFVFPKNGATLKDALVGATAKINLKNVVTGNPASEKNLTEAFFLKFEGANITAKIEDVMEGEKQGTLLLKVRMNKATQFVPMQYVLTDDGFVANGVIELKNFKLQKAFESLQEACGAMHKNFTWSQVEISLVIPNK
ncbi:hypothetical protein BBW65_04425 [Helicobacter enhydrae]|uniref:Lipid/polyisoprenoid-binding YceI-like domain-containing protein n=1 Tax=Helicobacter enhydrae TaxID=222136 RepID=A0A1B1U5T6_9HELI|nr:YceI family protein [Helicobacter enhydrae]ANV98091.1 hypothetical protein BBW65_04425 [Helicobacter enhydrae]